MAAASWMLRGRNIRSGRFNRSRSENEEDIIKLDLNRDPKESAREILLEICKVSGVTEGRRVNALNAFVKLILHVEGNLSRIAYTTEEVLYCLRIALISDYTLVRCAGLKAIRHILKSEEDVALFNKLNFPFLVARSLDLALKNDMERIQALSLIRKVLLLCASAFDIAMARSLVSIANCEIEERDRMLRACLACLSELGVLNSDVFILSGGVAAITRNLLECQTPRIAESLCGVLLFLLDRPITRISAAVDLHCIAAPYCDFHYKHGDERDLRFNCSRLAVLSVLRSWPGILHFCSPNNSLGLKAIVDILHINQLEVRKAILDLLYELLGLPQPEWTDELSVALGAIDPAEPQAAWRLGEGFVAAEGRSVLPHLARTTPNITDIHLALLLYCFLEIGLLTALAEVIASSDTFISVRATVLLGELLRLTQILLPPECCNVTPALPNLLQYALENTQALAAVTALQQLHKLLKRRPASSSLYLDYILQSGSFMKRSRNVEQSRKYKLGHSRSRLSQLVLRDGGDIIKDTGVMLSKDGFTWNWDTINIILKGECDFKLDFAESTHAAFLKRLIEFYMPSMNRYSHMDLTTSKSTHAYTSVGVELIYCLVRMEDPAATKLLLELFNDISAQIAAITTSRSAHDCLFSPQHMANTQCQSYFLFIGRLGSTQAGVDVLNSIKMFSQLQKLATTTKHDCYVKLIVSSLDYLEAGPARDLLAAVLKCPSENSRLYSTQFLQVLLRAGLPQFFSWGIKLLTAQLEDKSRTVHLTALAALHEACEVPSYLEQLVLLQPDLLHLGEKGVLLLIRFLSIPNGFNMLKKNDFVTNEIKRWDDFFNFRYVRIVEGEASDTLTLHQRGEDGRYDKRLSSLKVTSRKDLFLPPHIYGQLAKHSEGFHVLLEHSYIYKHIQFIENGLCETEEDILNMKVALWALGHLGGTVLGAELLNNKSVFAYMIRLAEHCLVYSIKATALFALAIVATTRFGADCLFKLGWACARHDRHNRWPVIEEENWQEVLPEEQVYNVLYGSESDRNSSEHAFAGDFFSTIPDVDSTDDFSYGETLTAQQKSSTLPCNQNPSSVQHKRSLSESKTFDVLKVQERKPDSVVFKLGSDPPHRHRDNSTSESIVSGVSSCESVLGRIALSEKVQNTLSPIPSSSSLSTLKTSAMRMRRHSESARRVSVQSMTPSDRSTVSPAGSVTGKLSHQDMVGYAMLRTLRSSRLPRTLYNEDELAEVFAPESLISGVSNKSKLSNLNNQAASFGDFRSRSFRKTYLDNMSLTSLSSVQKFSIKDDSKDKGQCYMGICMPRVLTKLFPDRFVSRRLSFTEKNMSYFTAFDNVSSSKSDPSLSEPEKEYKIINNLFTKHDTWTCLSCSRIRLKSREESSNSIASCSTADDSFPPGRFKDENNEIKSEILKYTDRLSNPVWMKLARLALLHQKQKHPLVFQDICLYSEVCKLMSEATYRLGPRRLLQELFLDVNYEVFYAEPSLILSENRKALHTTPPPDTAVQNFDNAKASYLNLVSEQRKAELSNSNKTTVIAAQTNRRIVSGFNLNKTSGNDDSLSPNRIEPRSPPLSSVKEENFSSTENLLAGETSISRRNTVDGDVGTSRTTVPPLKTLDSLNLSYSQNKFPIRSRSKSDPKTVIK